jgi:hypothetical protein
MPRVVCEPTTPVFEWAKTVHALDGAATVIGPIHIKLKNLKMLHQKGFCFSALILCVLYENRILYQSVVLNFGLWFRVQSAFV